MSKALSPIYPRLDMLCSPRLISQEEAKRMSKYRIIQKNLVHVQGFPDSILDCLENYEFLGQFGKITKMVIVKGKDEENQATIKKSNSAYVTFSTFEEAALAVLAVDSIYYENHYIRAFFGTSKYCIHFLNNKECYNKEKCMYLHYLASEADVLGNTCGLYSKFDYSEHLQIAITTSGVLYKERKDLILKAKYSWTVFPNIKSIYGKDIVIQAEKRQLDFTSQLQMNQCHNIHNRNKGSTQTSTNDEDASSSKSSGKCSENYSEQDYPLFHHRTQSRFFNDNSNKTDGNEGSIVPFDIIDLVDRLMLRYSFFKHFKGIEIQYQLLKHNDTTNINTTDNNSQLNESWFEFLNSNMKMFDD